MLLLQKVVLLCPHAPPPTLGTKPLSQENQLLLYALNQQATVGPNTTNKPWGWNVVEATKWQGWKELGAYAERAGWGVGRRPDGQQCAGVWWADPPGVGPPHTRGIR